MSLNVETDPSNEQEQIKDSMTYIFDGIKRILEKDEAGIFKLKASAKLDSETERIDVEIQKRIQYNLEKKSQNGKLNQRLDTLKKANAAKIQKLSERMVK